MDVVVAIVQILVANHDRRQVGLGDIQGRL